MNDPLRCHSTGALIAELEARGVHIVPPGFKIQELIGNHTIADEMIHVSSEERAAWMREDGRIKICRDMVRILIDHRIITTSIRQDFIARAEVSEYRFKILRKE